VPERAPHQHLTGVCRRLAQPAFAEADRARPGAVARRVVVRWRPPARPALLVREAP